MAGSNQGGRAINRSDKEILFEELGTRCYLFPILNHLERNPQVPGSNTRTISLLFV